MPLLTHASLASRGCPTADAETLLQRQPDRLEVGNIRFLIEQQLQIIDDLDRRGLDGQSAHDLLRRLMRRDEELRCRFFPLAGRSARPAPWAVGTAPV